MSRAGINFADTHARENSYLASYELPLIPGAEVAGEVDGRRVVALIGTGGYAEYAVAPERSAFPIPDGVRDDAALGIVVQGLTRLAPAARPPRTWPRARPSSSTPPRAASARSRSSSPSATAPAA